MQNISCKNKDSAFLLFLIIFPDPYFSFMQLLENLVFVDFFFIWGTYQWPLSVYAITSMHIA